jgi:light-regulated signal transduction histidine kinase (bacteriophytochrome)
LKYRSDKPPVINIDSERVGNQWLVRVSDNGIGIDSEYHQRIFMPFNRLHSREKYSGTGLGLALCQRIVQRYGGRIWVESQVGQGSTFSFTLPAEKLDASSFTAPS